MATIRAANGQWLVMTALCAGAALGADGRAAEAASDPFGWFGELAGSCWIGTDPSGRASDRQCYERQYGEFIHGKVELLAGSSTAVAAAVGESLFAWDARSSQIRYDSWASGAGRYGRGTARFEGATLVFPQEDEAGSSSSRLRSTWERLDADSFRVTRERAQGDGWQKQVSVLYRRDAGASAPSTSSAAPASGGPLEAFAFLAGSCWHGTFADGKTKDETCFEWALGGNALRSRHRVIGAKSPYEGETLFAFDAVRGQPFFVYWSSAGGIIRGTASPGAESIDFPSQQATMDGKSFELKSSWRRGGPDRYTAVNLRREAGNWEETMRIEYVRAGAEASSPAQ